MKISIILPAKNEEEIIAGAISEIQNHLKSKKCNYEILVVANGCSDKTEEITENLSKKDRKINLLVSEPGYGFALRKGLKIASGDYIVIFNVDFYDLGFIDICFSDLLGRDMIIGSKTASWAEDKRELWRRMISIFFNLFLKTATGFKGTDTHGIKVFRDKVVGKVLPKCKTSSGIFDSEFVLRTQYEGFKIADFPVTVKEIRESRFSKGFLRNMIDIIRLIRVLSK